MQVCIDDLKHVYVQIQKNKDKNININGFFLTDNMISIRIITSPREFKLEVKAWIDFNEDE